MKVGGELFFLMASQASKGKRFAKLLLAVVQITAVANVRDKNWRCSAMTSVTNGQIPLSKRVEKREHSREMSRIPDYFI